MRRVKGQVFITIIMCFLLLSGCSTTPSEKKIVEDIEDYINSCTIMYDPGEYIYTSEVSDNHTLQVHNVTVDKSKTEEFWYTGWYIIDLNDETIESKVYAKVTYQKYDGNKWVMEGYEEYQPREIKHKGGIILSQISDMFEVPITVNHIEILQEEYGESAKVSIRGLNKKGYYFSNMEHIIENPIEFETTITMSFDDNSLVWRADDLRINSKSITPFDTAIGNSLVYTAADIILSAADKTKYIGIGNYSLSPVSSNFTEEVTVANSGYAYSQASYTYDYKNSTDNYWEEGPMYLIVGFGDYELCPPFTYRIFSTLGMCRAGWQINRDYHISFNTSYWGYKGAELHIEYPYNGNEEVAYIKACSTSDPSGSKAIATTYPVSLVGSEKRVDINNVLIPFYHDDGHMSFWDEEDLNITIKMESISISSGSIIYLE